VKKIIFKAEETSGHPCEPQNFTQLSSNSSQGVQSHHGKRRISSELGCISGEGQKLLLVIWNYRLVNTNSTGLGIRNFLLLQCQFAVLLKPGLR